MQDDDEQPEGGVMDFWDHVEELRVAILRSLLGVGLGIALVAVFFIKFFSLMRWPLDWALAAEPGTLNALTTTNVMGSLSVLVQVCMIGGIAIGMPFVIWNIARFVGPGLTAKERAVIAPACLMTLVLFLIGAVFAFFIVTPAALKFTIMLNKMLGLETIWTAQSYYGFVAWTLIGVGLAFEFPLVIVILQYLGFVTPAQLRSGRRYAVIIIVVTAALITPGGDPISMSFLAVPMYFLYEAAILIGTRMVTRAEEAEAEFWDEDTYEDDDDSRGRD